MHASDTSATPAATVTADSTSPSPARTRSERLVSLDAFRGFTMFWLLGGNAFFVAIATWGGFESLRYQLAHSPWEGVRYHDLIWPSFMLMVGVSIPFSFARRSAHQTRAEIMRIAWKRALVLFLLGSLRESLSKGEPMLIELSSALQPIAIAYLVSSYLAGRSVRLQIGVAAGILSGYALLLAFVPSSGIPAGTYEKNRNLITAVDQMVLGRAHPGGWGTVLSTIPTIATTVIGLLMGQVLMSGAAARAKMKVIAFTGLGCLTGGFALSPFVPIIMRLWTTSYALVTTGWACLLLLAFFWIIDVRGWRRWAFPLVVIGMNALAAYLLPTLLPLGRIVGALTKPIVANAGTFGPVITSGVALALGWLILLWCHRRKIFFTA